MLRKLNPKPLIGDWLIVLTSVTLVIFMFQQFWTFEQPSKLRVRQGGQIFGTYDLNQARELQIIGPTGISTISISQGKVRFKQSPCRNQYCVHQGWLAHAGQVAICIPNQISLQLLGKQSSYDSLSY
jgi:hypothetical protein